VTDSFSIPPEIVCPISQGVFEDPGTTSDNFTYERVSIERWFQIRPSSPLTGLPLEDRSLRRHQPLYDQTKRWLSGDDIVQAAPPPRKRSRAANSRSAAAEVNLNFVTPACERCLKRFLWLASTSLLTAECVAFKNLSCCTYTVLCWNRPTSNWKVVESRPDPKLSEVSTARKNVSSRLDSRSGGMCLIIVLQILF
jgi:U-box domain